MFSFPTPTSTPTSPPTSTFPTNRPDKPLTTSGGTTAADRLGRGPTDMLPPDETPLGVLKTRLYEVHQKSDDLMTEGHLLQVRLPDGGTLFTSNYTMAPRDTLSSDTWEPSAKDRRPKQAILVQLPDGQPSARSPALTAPPSRSADSLSSLAPTLRDLELAREKLLAMVDGKLTSAVRETLGRNSLTDHAAAIVAVLQPHAVALCLQFGKQTLAEGSGLDPLLQQFVRQHFDAVASQVMGPGWDLAEYRFQNNVRAGVRHAMRQAREVFSQERLDELVSYMEPALRMVVDEEGMAGLATREHQSEIMEAAKRVAGMYTDPAGFARDLANAIN